jgi:LysM repeat protein
VPAGRTFFHTVGRGDTLQRIAARYGVTTQDIKRWNSLSQDSVRTGQKLRVTSDVSPIKSAGHGRSAQMARAKASKGKTGVAAGRDRFVANGGAKASSGTRVSANGH